MARTATVAGLILAALVAGCADAPASTATDDPTGDGDPAAAQVEAPVWAKGDWWNYTSPQAGAFTLVVTEAGPSGYTIGTDNAGIAFFDQRFDISYVGAQGRALQGSQGSDEVRFFDFPLTDQKAWTTRWDGLDIDVVAHSAGDGAFHMVATNDGAPYATYTFDEAVGWFSSIAFQLPNGTNAFEMTLQSSGTGFAGSIASWQLEELFNDGGDLASATGASLTPTEVPLTVTDVWAQVELDGTAGGVEMGVAPTPVVHAIAGLEDRGAGAPPPPCDGNPFFFAGSAGVPRAPYAGATSENWSYGVLAAPGTAGTYHLEVLLRTLVLTPL